MEDASPLDKENEMEEIQSDVDGTNCVNEETLEQAKASEEAELINEESNEILESEREKDMKKKTIKLEEENKKLQDEIDMFKDKLLRTTAEYENFRRRTAKEKEGIYVDACADVLKEVLPVLDNLERAISIDGSGEELRTGVEMTVRQFNDAFTKLGIEELPSEGNFDPNLHNAVMHIQDEDYGTNEIVEVFQKGYKKANKVLRHSMVKVAN
ncbi:nucleotide exchange factor GrpE [Clostridium sp. CS001]|uniref:nucleotide exchange factor GrpE n=1 Tax=Clostridium sp. CS001 TaxID=2880648 RepID=UPI0039A46824